MRFLGISNLLRIRCRTRNLTRNEYVICNLYHGSGFSSIANDNNTDNESNSDSHASPITPEMFRSQNQINLKGVSDLEDFPPMIEFSNTPFSNPILRVLKAQGFVSPTPIQAQSWPIALSERDVISVARTGSGKSLGFLLPIFHKILLKRQSAPQSKLSFSGQRDMAFGRPPTALILAPTRELTMQISAEAGKFSRDLNIHSYCIYGGQSRSLQIKTMSRGIDVLVATPGRCIDLMETGGLDLSKVKYLVLDEADRMLDMGFEPQITRIYEELPKEKQCLFYTATWPREVQQLAREFLRNPIQLNVGESDVLNANKAITQNVLMVKTSDKESELLRLLEELNPNGPEDLSKMPKLLIFVSRKSQCEDIAEALYQAGYFADSLHGDKTQQARTRVMERFRDGRIQILVATDVAARGLDIKDIEVVINFDFPVGSSGVEDYVHRIGRTARGDKKGTAYTFFTKDDYDRAKELVDVLRRAEQALPPELVEIATPSRYSNSFNRSGGMARGRGSRDGGGYRGRNRNDDVRDAYANRVPRGSEEEEGDDGRGRYERRNNYNDDRGRDRMSNRRF